MTDRESPPEPPTPESEWELPSEDLDERRGQAIATARSSDVLNASFILRRFAGQRYPRRRAFLGLYPHDILGDLFSDEEIDQAHERVFALLRDANQYQWEPGRSEEHAAELAAAHPGFTTHHILEALNIGYDYNRRPSY